MAESPVSLVTEGRAEELALKAIFRDEIDRGMVEVIFRSDSSSALIAVRDSVLFGPSPPMALVINDEEDPEQEIEARRATIGRILHGAGPGTWHVSIAQPSVDAWVMADPAIRAIFEAKEATRTNPSQRAREIGEVAARRPIDREAIARAHPDFRSLVEFIAAHARASEAVA